MLHFPLTVDGATGTHLIAAGMPKGCCPEAWVLEHPEVITRLQGAYAAAGSQAVYAPTFGCNRPLLERYGLAGKQREMILRLVDLSRAAVPADVLVAGDVSTTGLMPEPYGETEFDEFVEIFSQQGRFLEEAGVDCFAVETQLCGEEALAAVTALRQESKKPILVSFTLGATGRTFWGESLPELAARFLPLDIQAFGVNCCDDLDLLERVLAELHAATDLPLIAKPNAGKPRMEGDTAHYDLTPEALAGHVPAYLQAGARVLGGCCGTGPEHIRAIRAAVENYKA